MSKEEVTVMILYVDLKCSCCYNKVRKLLCKFPQIRDQVFEEDKNKVRITVVCCDPERLRDKLCCKGGKAIQSIEILEPEPPKPPKPPKPQPQPQPQPITMPKPGPLPVIPQPKIPRPEPVKMPKPVLVPTDPMRPPVSACCQECYEGRGGGPCHYGYGRPVPPPPGPCYDGYRPVPPPPGPCYDGYGYWYRPPCYYFSEENPQACSIM